MRRRGEAFADPRGLPLTAREIEVVRGYVWLGSRAAVARELGISVHTVKHTMARAYRKVGASGRLAVLAVIARYPEAFVSR